MHDSISGQTLCELGIAGATGQTKIDVKAYESLEDNRWFLIC